MIGTFWNLCRACPSMPVDKLHSEYRSTYKWHEYTGPRQEVVRHPPQPVSGNKEEEETKYIDNTSAMQGVIEPAMPRRKKNPSLAYRTNEFISTKSEKDNYHTSTSLDRARCAGRDIADGSCRRSKSEGPPDQASPYHQRVLRSDSDPSAQQLVITNFPMENCRTNGLKNAINRISTEYRLQFAWPRGNKWKEEDSSNSSLPRKSLSMGAIKPQSGVAPVHKKQRALNQEGNSEMEPLVAATDGELNGEEKIIEESFSKEDNHLMREGKLKTQKEENLLPETWFSEVIELRKKAGQYKHRGWGTELVPEHIAELYSKQVGLWEQVSRRSSLSALSLASSTHRSISKEEKEKENNKKSSPTKSSWSQKHKVDADIKYMVPHRSRLDTFVRHHLERTTGVGEEGILHSPTREKLEPVIPRRKDTVSDVNTSPKKTTFSGRSQSAGSPKKMPSRSQHKTPPPEKRQRPTTLQTAPTRTKSRTGSVKAKNRGPHKDKSNKESKPKEDIEAVVAPEPVVKSPPEPTRVKSPEQIVMRSPEPVNWTVPLDTGKTFTVTQNVVHGDLHWRAHSEGKARSESSSRPPPPPPSQSAPPVLSDPKKDGDKVEGMRCLDDPSFSFESEGTTGGDVLQKAHSRFDQFWGASQETQDKQQSTPASQF